LIGKNLMHETFGAGADAVDALFAGLFGDERQAELCCALPGRKPRTEWGCQLVACMMVPPNASETLRAASPRLFDCPIWVAGSQLR
jgi:hypothetical protein